MSDSNDNVKTLFDAGVKGYSAVGRHYYDIGWLSAIRYPGADGFSDHTAGRRVGRGSGRGGSGRVLILYLDDRLVGLSRGGGSLLRPHIRYEACARSSGPDDGIHCLST